MNIKCKPSASFRATSLRSGSGTGSQRILRPGSVLPAPLTKKSVFRVPVGASEERQPRMMSDLSAPPSAAVHLLRSGSVYENATIYTHPNNAFNKAFRAAMCYFQLRKPIPPSLLADLEKFTLTSAEFKTLVSAKEDSRLQHVYMDNGKIRFNYFTLKPHGDVIIEITSQISSQDQNNYFKLSTGQGIVSPTPPAGARSCVNIYDIDVWLNNSNKQPDAALRIRPSRWPKFPNPHPFQINQADGSIAPGFVFEIGVSNETMPTLSQADVARYFLPNTGIRFWIGVKVWKHDNGHRWWVGSASRDFVAGTWQNTYTLHIHPLFPIVQSHNRLVSLPVPGQVINIPVNDLVHPLPLPVGCPALFTVDLELLRQIIEESD